MASRTYPVCGRTAVAVAEREALEPLRAVQPERRLPVLPVPVVALRPPRPLQVHLLPLLAHPLQDSAVVLPELLPLLDPEEAAL